MKSSVVFGTVQFDKTHSVDCCRLKGDSLPYILYGKPKAKRRHFVDKGPGVECEWKGKALNLLTDISLATPTLLSLGPVSHLSALGRSTTVDDETCSTLNFWGQICLLPFACRAFPQDHSLPSSDDFTDQDKGIDLGKEAQVVSQPALSIFGHLGESPANQSQFSTSFRINHQNWG